MAALSQTGSGTGGINSLVGHCFVTQRINGGAAFDLAATIGAGHNSSLAFIYAIRLHLCGSLLHIVTLGGNHIAALGMTTASFTGKDCGLTLVFTIRIHLVCSLLHIVAQGRNYILGNQDFLTTVTVAAFGLTFHSAGGIHSSIGDCVMALGRNGFLGNDHFAADGAVLALGLTFSGTGRSYCLVHNFGVTGGRNLGGRSIGITPGTLGGLGTCGLTGSGGSNVFHQNMPLAVCVEILADRVCLANRCRIGTIGILQLCSIYGDGIIGTCCLPQLVGGSICCIAQLDRTAAGAMDVRAACGGIGIAGGSINGAIDLDHSVLQVRSGAGVGFTGCIDNRSKSFVLVAVSICPLVGIVDIDLVAAVQGADGTSIHGKFHTGQDGNILLDGNIAAGLDPDSHVAVQRQIKILGINSLNRHPHADRSHADIALKLHHKAVPAAVIPLGNGTAGHGEHRVAGTDKRHSQTNIRAGHVDIGIAFFGGTCLQGQGHFHILHIILAEGEHPVLHTSSLATAAEVHKLEAFIHGRTLLCGHRAGAGNETPDIQTTTVAHGNGAVLAHLHKAGRTGRRAGSIASVTGNHLTRKAHGTIDHNVGTFCHGQGPVSSRSRSAISGIVRFCSIQGTCGVKGDQQGVTLVNGVSTGAQSSIIHQNDLLALCQRFRQTFHHVGLVYQEYRGRSCKYSLHRHGGFRCKRPGRLPAQDLVIAISPGNELTAVGRDCRKGRTCNRDLCHNTIRNDFAADGHRTKFCVVANGNVHITSQGFTGEIGQGHCTGITGTFGRSQRKLDIFIGFECYSVGSLCQINLTIADTPRKTNCCLFARFVGDSHSGRIAAISRTTTSTRSNTFDSHSKHTVSYYSGPFTVGTYSHRNTFRNCIISSCRQHHRAILTQEHLIVEAQDQLGIALTEDDLLLFCRQLLAAADHPIHFTYSKGTQALFQIKIQILQYRVGHICAQAQFLDIRSHISTQLNQFRAFIAFLGSLGGLYHRLRGFLDSLGSFHNSFRSFHYGLCGLLNLFTRKLPGFL